MRLILGYFNPIFDHESTTFGMYSACIIIGCVCTLPLWGRFKPLAIGVIMLFVGIMTVTEIRTVWVGFFIAYLFIVGFCFLLRVPHKHLATGSAAIFLSILLTVFFLKIGHPGKYEGVKQEFFSMFAGTKTPNLMTRVAMWEDAIEAVIPVVGPLFDFVDRKVLNPYLFGSETRPAERQMDEVSQREALYLSKEKSATDMLLRYGKSSKENILALPKSAEVKVEEKKPDVVPVPPPPPKPAVVKVEEKKPVVVPAPPPPKPVAVKVAEKKPDVVPAPKPSISLRARLDHELNQFKSFIGENRILRMFFGVPFGHRFVPGRIAWVHQVNRYDPHNSLIAILYRTGLVGFVSFLLLTGAAFWNALKSIKMATELDGKYVLFAVMSCLVYHLGHSLTDVTLENPFRGVLFWFLLGLMMVLTSMINKKEAFS